MCFVFFFFPTQLVLYTFKSSENLHSFVSQNISQVRIVILSAACKHVTVFQMRVTFGSRFLLKTLGSDFEARHFRLEGIGPSKFELSSTFDPAVDLNPFGSTRKTGCQQSSFGQ